MSYPMTEVIASRTFTRTRPDNVATEVTVEIGLPAPVPQEKGLPGHFYCPCRIVGIQSDDHVYTGVGVSSAEALSNLLPLPGQLLSALPFAAELDLYGLPNFGFPVLPTNLKRVKRP